MGWIDGELVLVALAAMVSPTTLSFSVLALVLGDRPLRTGGWFWLGAFIATLVIGVVAAFVLGDAAGAPKPSSPKTWVAILDVVFAALIVFYVVRLLRRPPDPKRAAGMIERMGKLASSPAVAIVGAGAALANPGGFIPIALKSISETKPNAGQYIAEWAAFTLIALLPLAVALVMLIFARERTMGVLIAARGWLERRARIVAAVLLLLLAAALLRNGIAGLTS
jgi:hypothetical protein